LKCCVHRDHGDVVAGLLSMAAIALTQSENQGHLAARTRMRGQDGTDVLRSATRRATRVFPAQRGGTKNRSGRQRRPGRAGHGCVDYLDAGAICSQSFRRSPVGWFTTGVEDHTITTSKKSA
jgi:hypothetical protein